MLVCAGALYVTLNCCWVALLSVSLATTVTVFAPGVRVIVAFQLAVLLPLAVPPLAVTPLTVTEEMPLLPWSASLAVPVTGRLALVTVALLAGEVIVSAGGVVSDGAVIPVPEAGMVLTPLVASELTVTVPPYVVADVGENVTVTFCDVLALKQAS